MWKGSAPTHKIWVVKKKRRCHNSYPALPKRTIHSFLLNKMLRACFSSDVAHLSLSKMCLTKYKVYRRKNILKKRRLQRDLMLYKPAYFLYYVLFDRMQQSIFICFYQSTLKSTLRGKHAIIVSVFKWPNFCCFVSVPMLIDISLKGMSGKTSDLCRSLPMSSKMSTGLLIFI